MFLPVRRVNITEEEMNKYFRPVKSGEGSAEKSPNKDDTGASKNAPKH